MESSGLAADVRAAEVETGRVGDHVRAPGRVGREPHPVLRLIRRARAASARCRPAPPRVTRRPGASATPRRARSCRAPRQPSRSPRSGRDRRRSHDGRARRTPLPARLSPRTISAPTSAMPSLSTACGVGTSWMPSSIAPRSRISSCSLTACSVWWPGYTSCAARWIEVAAGGRHVDVQDDTAPQIAEVVVERPPRLVGDRFEHELLPCGEVDDGGGSLAQQRQQVGEDRDATPPSTCWLSRATPDGARRGSRRPATARRVARARPRRR